MSKKKTMPIIVVVIVVLLAVGIYYVARGGFTGKQRYENCMETCYDLLFMNSSKVYCSGECTEDTGYNPDATEEQELINELKNANKNTNTANVNAGTTRTTNTASNKNTNTKTNTINNTNAIANTNTATNTNTTANVNTPTIDYENITYYCEWSWPQKVINKDTQEVIKACTSSRPWCNTADGTYEKVGCCKDREHMECLTVAELIQ